jgi:hypothetical protein
LHILSFFGDKENDEFKNRRLHSTHSGKWFMMINEKYRLRPRQVDQKGARIDGSNGNSDHIHHHFFCPRRRRYFEKGLDPAAHPQTSGHFFVNYGQLVVYLHVPQFFGTGLIVYNKFRTAIIPKNTKEREGIG